MSKVSIVELAKYAVDRIEAGENPTSLSKKLAAFLIDERRSREAASLMRMGDEELTRRGKPQVNITAAHDVSEEVKKQLAQLLEVNNPTFSETIDPAVIGGVRARSGESEIDLTIQSKLQTFKSRIATGS